MIFISDRSFSAATLLHFHTNLFNHQHTFSKDASNYLCSNMEFTQSPREKAEALISTLVKYGQGDYIGESISQLEHSLQAANQARNDRKSFTYQIN